MDNDVVSAVMLPPGPSLAILPDAIAFQFLRIARQVICRRLVPVVWKRAALRRRMRRVARRTLFVDMKVAERTCENALISASEFVVSVGINDTARILSRDAKPQSFQAGEIIVHEGEGCEAGIVVILQGKVNLFERVFTNQNSTNYYKSLGIALPKSAPPEFVPIPVTAIKSDDTAGLLLDDISCTDDHHGSHHDYMMRNPEELLDFRGENHPRHLRYCFKKPKGLCSTRFLRTVEAPYVVGDLQQLNAEPRLYYVVAAGDVDVMIIPRRTLLNLFQSFPNPNIAIRLSSVAHAIRANTMPRAFPLSTSRLRMSPLLRSLTNDELQGILTRVKPRVFAKGLTIVEKGKGISSLFFIRRGVVLQTFEEGEENYLLWEGATFGEREAYFKEKAEFTLTAHTNVDVYVLELSELAKLCSHSETMRTKISDASLLVKQQSNLHRVNTERSIVGRSNLSAQHYGNSMDNSLQLSNSVAFLTVPGQKKTVPSASRSTHFLVPTTSGVHRYVELMQKIPLWSIVGFPEGAMEELRLRWTPTMFGRGEYLCRKSELCSSMMIILKGTAKLCDAPSGGPFYQHYQEHLALNECIGYTCLLRHRWSYSIITTDSCEVLVLPRDTLVTFLKDWDARSSDESTNSGVSLVLENSGDLSGNQSIVLVQKKGGGHRQHGLNQGRLLDKLVAATTQLMQPLLFAPGLQRFPELDAAVRRFPNPNSLPDLKIPNLHPVSKEEYNVAFPHMLNEAVKGFPNSKANSDVQSLVGKSKSKAETSRLKKLNDAAREEVLTNVESQLAQLKLVSRRSQSIMVSENATTDHRRRRSLGSVDRLTTPIDKKIATPTVQNDLGLKIPAPPKGNAGTPLVGTSAMLGVFQTSFFESSFNSHQNVTSAKLTPVADPAGNLIGGSPCAQPPSATKALAKSTDSFHTMPQPSLYDFEGVNSFRSNISVAEAHVDRGGANSVQKDVPPTAVAPTYDERVERRDAKLKKIMEDNPTDEEAIPSSRRETLPTQRSVALMQQDDHGDEVQEGVKAPQPPPKPTDSQSRLLRKARMPKVQPHAKKTLTYSASENYGSLLGTLLSGRSDEKSEGTSPRRHFMWRSCNIAAPLSSDRPRSAILQARIDDALRAIDQERQGNTGGPMSTTPQSSPRPKFNGLR